MLDTENKCAETYLKDLSCEYTIQVILNPAMNASQVNNLGWFIDSIAYSDEM